MTALFVIFMVLVFLGMDYLVQRKRNPKTVVQEMHFYNPQVGLTMADGGEKIEDKKEDKKE